MSEAEIVNDKQSSIMIEKNSKGYNWTAKLYYDEEKVKHSDIITRLEKIDKELQQKFGGLQ